MSSFWLYARAVKFYICVKVYPFSQSRPQMLPDPQPFREGLGPRLNLSILFLYTMVRINKTADLLHGPHILQKQQNSV